jgi:integrase
VKLTEATVTKLLGKKPGKTADVIVFDDDLPGFGLRIRDGGSKTWVYQYKLGTQHRRISLGKYPALPPAAARKTASKLHAQVRLGDDPAAAKAEKQAKAAETFGAVLKTYLARRRGQIRDSSLREVERHLQRNLAPLHSVPVDKLDRRTIAAQLARLTMEAGPIQANRTRASCAKFLNWCLAEGLTENNPAMHTNKNAEKSRDRVLSDKELKAIWKALPENDYGAIVRLLILTGQRAAEIAGLRWSEIDFDRNVIVLPGNRTKNHRSHIVPLSKPARAILEARLQHNGRDLVFGIGERGFSGWSKSKARLDDALAVAPPFVIHDIRRSAATHMAELGIQPHVIEAVLNHVSGSKSGVAGIYNRAAYETEKATALSRWAEHVAAIVEGRKNNVRPLRGAS